MLIYITGASGAGKSTVRTELQRRGFPAYDSDDDRLARNSPRYGTILVNAGRPISDLVDDVVARLKLPRSA